MSSTAIGVCILCFLLFVIIGNVDGAPSKFDDRRLGKEDARQDGSTHSPLVRACPLESDAIVPDDYPSLGDAIAAGERSVFVRSGTYEEKSTIQISAADTTVRGEHRTNTILKYKGSASFLLITDTRRVSVSGLTLDAITYDSDSNRIWEAVGVVGSSFVAISDCKILGSDHMFAVFFAGPRLGGGQPTIDAFHARNLDEGNEISSCLIKSNFPGDVLSFSLQTNGLVHRNKVIGGVISFFMNVDSRCTRNTVRDSATWGIFVSVPAVNNVIARNRVRRSRSSAFKVARQIDHVDSNGVSLTPSTYRAPGLVFTGNSVADTRYFGFEIDQTVGVLVHKNSVETTDYSSVYILGSDDARITKNAVDAFGFVARREEVTWPWDVEQSSGIFCDVGTVRARIQSNEVTGTPGLGKFGMKIAPWAESTGSLIKGNTLYGSFEHAAIDPAAQNGNRAKNNQIFPSRYRAAR